VQIIAEPSSEVYFNVNYSPIISQFRFIYEIGEKMEDYKYAEPPYDASIYEQFKAAPSYNLFDFWWLYRYFIIRSYSGFFIALILFSFAIYAAVKLRNIIVV
jgi:hypothetical protein